MSSDSGLEARVRAIEAFLSSAFPGRFPQGTTQTHARHDLLQEQALREQIMRSLRLNDPPQQQPQQQPQQRVIVGGNACSDVYFAPPRQLSSADGSSRPPLVRRFELRSL